MTDTTTLPAENRLRGALFALIALPLGVIVWTLLWQAGFIASIVAFGVAFLAAFLYRFGSGGRISGVGAVIVLGITVVTLALAFYIGMVAELAFAIASIQGMSALDVVQNPYFPEAFAIYLDDNAGSLAVDAVVAAAFAALGSFGILRAVFQQAKAENAVPLTTPAGFEPGSLIMPSQATPAPDEPGEKDPEPDAAK